MNHNYKFRVMSDSDYEKLIVEVFCGADFKKDFVGIISQESGSDSLDLEVFPRTDGKPWKLKIKDFINALDQAKKQLLT